MWSYKGRKGAILQVVNSRKFFARLSLLLLQGMTEFQLEGCSIEELQALVAKHAPDRSIIITQKGGGSGMMSEVELLKNKLEEKTKECVELEGAAGKAMLSIESIHQQQQSLFDDFVILRNKYDEQKHALVETLKDCARTIPNSRTFLSRRILRLILKTKIRWGTMSLTRYWRQFATVGDAGGRNT